MSRAAEVRLLFTEYFAKQVYWPRAVRDTVAEVIEQMKPDSPLVLLLRENTSTYLTAKQRKEAVAAYIAALLKGYWRLPPSPSVRTKPPEWPFISVNEDLLLRPGRMQVRLDVLAFLMHRLRQASIQSSGITLTPDIRSDRPLVIWSATALSTDEIAHVFAPNVDNGDVDVLASDLIRWKIATPLAGPIHSVHGEEHDGNISGGPTLGMFLRPKQSPNPTEPCMLALTAAHAVHGVGKARACEYSVVQKVHLPDFGADAALIQLGEDHFASRNSCAIVFPNDTFTLVLGERVWKIGAATGLTEGTLVSANWTGEIAKAQLHNYTNMIAVKWGTHGEAIPERFASSGDSGALYVVRRGNAFVGIGLHVNTDDSLGISVASPISTIVDFMPLLDAYEPVNPPHSAIQPHAMETVTEALMKLKLVNGKNAPALE